MGVEPITAVLQTAATPRDSSVKISSLSLPGVEPGPRPSQSRVLPLHLKDKVEKYPAEESNLVRLLRKQSCVHHTRRASSSLSRPGIEPGPGPSESPMQSATPSGQSRRLDSRQYGSAYKADAFLSRATSAISTSVRIRTPSSGFGNHPLSQEHTRVKLPGQDVPAAVVIHPVPQSSTPP